MNPIFLKKEDERLPDYYGLKVHYITSGCDEFQAASHMVLKETGILEIVTHDDLWTLIPVQNIKKIEFDKSFSKIVAIKQEQKKAS